MGRRFPRESGAYVVYMQARQGPLLETDAGPGLCDVEAAVELVAAGLARQIVLAGFPAWPEMLGRAREIAEEANVAILPAVGSGGTDIVIMRLPADR
jgi:hypothetical protein